MALYARKANIETVISEDKIDKYIADGYKVFDGAGNLVKESAPDDLTTLKKAYTDHLAELKVKDAEIARLKDELTRAQEFIKSMETKASTASAGNESATAEKPKRTRTKKTASAETEA